MSLISFDLAIDKVLKHEGSLVDNPNDPGGITNLGISLRFLKGVNPLSLKKYGFNPETINKDTIKQLTLDQAKTLYLHEFWEHAPFSRINRQDLATYLFDMAVNMGIAPAIKCIQRACWAVLHDRSIVDDGVMGDKTIDAINQCGFYLLPVLRAERSSYYRCIVTRNPSQQEFLNGWLNRTYEE